MALMLRQECRTYTMRLTLANMSPVIVLKCGTARPHVRAVFFADSVTPRFARGWRLVTRAGAKGSVTCSGDPTPLPLGEGASDGGYQLAASGA